MKKRVLVVENEPWLGEQFEKTLAKGGFDVSVATNAYGAIDIVDAHKPSVIVMGLMLSGINGLGLLHELQSYMDTARIPVVVCMDPSTELSLDELHPYGIERLLDMSTMRPADLVGAVRSVLGPL